MGGVTETEIPENFSLSGPEWQEFLLHTPDCVLDVNFETRSMRCSASLAQSLRLTQDTLPHTIEQWLELYHPDDYAKSLEFRKHLFEETINAFSLERRIYCGDGVYRLFRVNAMCFRGARREIKRLIAVETDVSGYRRDNPELAAKLRALKNELAALKSDNARLSVSLAQKNLQGEALEKRARLMTHMLDASPDLIFCCDAAGRVMICNEAFSNALARNPDLTQWAAELAQTGRGAETERRYYDANGRARNLAAETRAVSQRGGEDGYAGIARDITEAEETLEDMTRLKRLLGRHAMAGAAGAAIEAPLSIEISTEKNLDGGEPHGADLNTALEARLQKALHAFASVSGLFPARTEQLENLLRSARNTELEVGVVGITSSGKSAFINAMMGEKLLPEETRATTNLVIRCRKGAERSVAAISKNGERKSAYGSQLTAAWVESMASERLNPQNEQNVAFLEWTSPGAALPEGLTLVDTPGLDACGFPEHSELVLRSLLPNLDIVLYVTSIRNRFKTADLELLEAVLEQDQRVIFLLSQIDLEQDDVEGGKVVLSRGQKLASYVDGLYQDIGAGFPENSRLRRSAVIAVSSKLAAAHFYDRESEEWSASNFGTLIGQLEAYRSNLNRCRFETRARRSLVLLSRAASDAELAIARLSTEKARAEESSRLEKVRELRDAQRWTNAEISAVRNEWRRHLDPEYHLKRLRQEIETANTVKGMKDRYERWDEEWADLVAKMTDRMDRARQSCAETLSRHGISPDDRAAGAAPLKSELPAFHGYVVQVPQEVRVRGWFEALEFWPRYSVFFKQKVDKNKLMESSEALITERLRFLNDHLSWWENRMRENYCDPLYGELSREDAALADIRRSVSDVSVSRKALLQVLLNIREARRGIQDALTDLALSCELDAEAPPQTPPKGLGPFGIPEIPEISGIPFNLNQSVLNMEGNAEDNLEDAPGYGLFTPLLASFQEQNIQSRFMELEALRHRKRIVLLGLRRHDSLRLLSRLAHDAAFFDAMKTEDGQDIDERDWIFRGAVPPALPHVRINLPDTLLRELEVLVAPSDGLCVFDRGAPRGGVTNAMPVDWNDLFAEWLPVVHIDIARIDSGLSDLARAPYAKALANAERWVAASGQGALFNARLSDLLTDVPERLSLFTGRRGYKGRAEWFVYENYDARYTDFMLWGHDTDWNTEAGADTDKYLLDKWLSGGRDFRFPFSEFRIRLALEGARRKSGRKSAWSDQALLTAEPGLPVEGPGPSGAEPL